LKLSKCVPLFFLDGGDIVGFWVTRQLTSHHLWGHQFGSNLMQV